MPIGGHGKRLVSLRKMTGNSAKKTVQIMQEAGHKITLNQFYELQKDQWPTRQQVDIVCKFFNVTPEWWLCGIERGRIDELTQEEKKDVMRIIEHLAKNKAK